MRILCLLLITAFSLAYAHAGEHRIITSGGFQGIANDEGRVIVPAIYERLGWSDGGGEIVGNAVGYYENGKWGLINLSNQKITNARYATLKPFNDRLYEAGIKGQFSNQTFRGLIDNRSNVQLDFRYYTLEDIGDHRIVVSEYAQGGLKYGLFSDENEQVIPTDYHSLSREGDLILAESKIRKKRIFNLDGRQLLPIWVDQVVRSGANYIVTNEGYYGLINGDGHWIHKLHYKNINEGEPSSFPMWEISELNGELNRTFLCDSISYNDQTGLLIAHVNRSEHMLSASETLFKDQQHSLKHIGNGYLVTRNQTLQTWGIYKTDGTEVAAGFDTVAVDSSYFYVRSANGWDIYNFFGRKINTRPFQDLSASQEFNVPTKKNDYWGWVDFQGQRLINYRYEAVEGTTNEGQFIAKNYGRWGVHTFDDEWLIMPRYDSMSAYGHFYLGRKGYATHVYNHKGDLLHELPFRVKREDFLAVYNQGKVGAITSKGYLINPDFQAIEVHDGYYELSTEDFSSLVATDGRVVFSKEEEISGVLSFSEGYFHIIKDGKHGFVDTNGNLRIANRYDSAQYFNEGLAPVKLLGKWGYIEPYENLVIQPFYKNSSVFSDGLAIIQTGLKFGIIDKDGEEVVKPEWKLISRLPTGNYRIIDWDGKVGLADKQGKFIVRPNYSQLEDTNRSLIIASKGDSKGVLDYTGLTKVPFQFMDIQIKGDYLLLRKD